MVVEFGGEVVLQPKQALLGVPQDVVGPVADTSDIAGFADSAHAGAFTRYLPSANRLLLDALCQQTFACLRTLLAVGLCLAEQLDHLVVAVALGVADVGLEPQRSRPTRPFWVTNRRA